MTAGAWQYNGAGVKTGRDLTPCGMDTWGAKKKYAKRANLFYFFRWRRYFFIFFRAPKRTAQGPRCVGNWAPVLNGCHRYRRWFLFDRGSEYFEAVLSGIRLLFCLIDVKFLMSSYLSIFFLLFHPPSQRLTLTARIKINMMLLYLHMNILCRKTAIANTNYEMG